MAATDEQIVRLYDTVFDRSPDLGGLEFWRAAAGRGVTLDQMAEFFMTAPEFAATYGQPDNPSFVRSMYENVLDRPGEAEGVQFWTRALDSGAADRGDIVVYFSESPEHIQQLAASAAAAAPASGPTPPAPSPPLAGAGRIDTDSTSGPAEVRGGPGNDVLDGGAGRDVIYGFEGSDALSAGGGDDLLFGGAGADYMFGDAGADVFGYEAAAHMERDTIAGFEVGTDLLDFRGLGLAFRGQGAFEANGQAQLRYVDNYTPRAAAQSRIPGSTQVYADADGNGVPDAVLTVEFQALTDASFLV